MSTKKKQELVVEEVVVKKEPKAVAGSNDNKVVESVESILALLRGIGPVLVGSSPDPSAVEQLLDDLKDPR